MNKKLTLLLFIGLAWGQTSDIDILEHTKKLRQKLKNDSLNNPCNDKRYLELKKVAVTKMTKEDLKYYRSMRKKCSESKGSKPKSNRSRSGKSFKIIQKEIKEFAYRKYPFDESMQKYVYKNQVNAYKYLLTVQDIQILKIAERKYPDDYEMQKYVYDNQLSAKKYMKSVKKSRLKSMAIDKYPNDYEMQKYIYDESAF